MREQFWRLALLLQPACEKRAQALGVDRCEARKHAVTIWGDVVRGCALGSEHVVREQRAPCGARRRRQRSQVKDRMQQTVEPGITAGRIAAPRVPPVVDQQIERLQRLDVVPPERGDEYGIARSELHGPAGRERLAEARKTREVRAVQPYQTHRRPGGCEVERSNVEVAKLLRWKQIVSAPPRAAA